MARACALTSTWRSCWKIPPTRALLHRDPASPDQPFFQKHALPVRRRGRQLRHQPVQFLDIGRRHGACPLAFAVGHGHRDDSASSGLPTRPLFSASSWRASSSSLSPYTLFEMEASDNAVLNGPAAQNADKQRAGALALRANRPPSAPCRRRISPIRGERHTAGRLAVGRHQLRRRFIARRNQKRHHSPRQKARHKRLRQPLPVCPQQAGMLQNRRGRFPGRVFGQHMRPRGGMRNAFFRRTPRIPIPRRRRCPAVAVLPACSAFPSFSSAWNHTQLDNRGHIACRPAEQQRIARNVLILRLALYVKPEPSATPAARCSPANARPWARSPGSPSCACS